MLLVFQPECPVWTSSINVLTKDAQSRTGPWTSGGLSSRSSDSVLLLVFGSITATLIVTILDVRNGAFIGENRWLTRIAHVKVNLYYRNVNIQHVCLG